LVNSKPVIKESISSFYAT
jgi:hypothetical protein